MMFIPEVGYSFIKYSDKLELNICSLILRVISLILIVQSAKYKEYFYCIHFKEFRIYIIVHFIMIQYLKVKYRIVH